MADSSDDYVHLQRILLRAVGAVDLTAVALARESGSHGRASWQGRLHQQRFHRKSRAARPSQERQWARVDTVIKVKSASL